MTEDPTATAAGPDTPPFADPVRELALSRGRERVDKELTAQVAAKAGRAAIMGTAVVSLVRDLGITLASILEVRPDGHIATHARSTFGAGEATVRLVTEGNVPIAELINSDRAQHVQFATDSGLDLGTDARGRTVRPLVGACCSFVAAGETHLVVAVATHQMPFDHHELEYLTSFSQTLGRALRHSADLERLAETEQQFRHLVEDVPAIIYTRNLGPDPVATYVSPQVERLLGLSPEELVADPSLWLKRLHPEDLPGAARALAKHSAEFTPFEYEYRVFDKDGKTLWLRDRSVVVRGADNTPLYSHGVLIDITAEKRAQAQAAEQRRRLDTVIAVSPIVVVAVDSTGTNEFVSGAVASVAGRQPEELMGQSALQHIHPDDAGEMAAGFADMMAGNAVRSNMRMRYQHADGRWLVVDCRGEVVTNDNDPTGVVYAMMDITSEVQLADEVRKAKDAAERSSRAKNDFLARMSHELRTPLNAVLGFGQLLQLGELDPDQHESVEQVLGAGRHLLTLIDEVLDISKIESGQIAMSPEPMGLREAATDVLNLVRTQAREQGVTVTLGEGLDRSVLADHQRAKQVLLNLVSNAIKYNHAGGSVVLSAQTSTAPSMVRVQVTDNGRGIAPELLDRVFVAFDRLGAETTAVEGTGLGLALSRGIVLAMGGTMGVESTLGEGSDFWFELPATAATVMEPEAAAHRSINAVAGEMSGHVLYIEDNPSNQRLLERLMDRFPDISLEMASDGTTGLAAVRAQRPNLVLLDVNLPDIGGEEVLVELRADPSTRDIPVIVLSADATSHQMQQMMLAGARSYITKPIDVPRLVGAMADALQGRAARAATPATPDI